MFTIADVGTVAQLLRDCLEAELAQVKTGYPPPERIDVRPGESATADLGTMEDQCRCGLAWVRMGSPAPDVGEDTPRTAGGDLCGPFYWNVPFELGVLRCPAFGTEQRGPSETEQLADALRQYADMGAMRRVWYCCTDDEGRLLGEPGPYEAVGPQGMCLGGTWTGTVRLLHCEDC